VQVPLEDGSNITGQKFIAGPVRSISRERWEKEHETESGGAHKTGNLETGSDTHRYGHFILHFIDTKLREGIRQTDGSKVLAHLDLIPCC